MPSKLVATFSTGQKLEFGPGPLKLMEARAKELWDAGARDATFQIDGALFTFAQDITEPARSVPTGDQTECAVSPPRQDQGTSQPLTVDRAAEIAESLLRSTTAQCERLLRLTHENTVTQARVADEILAKSHERALEHDRHARRYQAEQTATMLEQAIAVQKFVSTLNATVATERAALFQIRENEQKMAQRQAEIDDARARAAIAASRPSAAQIATDFVAAFAVRYAQNATANFTAMNGDHDAETTIVTTGAINEPRRN